MRRVRLLRQLQIFNFLASSQVVLSRFLQLIYDQVLQFLNSKIYLVMRGLVRQSVRVEL